MDLGVAGDYGLLGNDGVVKDPAAFLLAEVVLRLDEATQIPLTDAFLHISQSLDAVEPGMVRVGDVGNAVFLFYRSSPRFFLMIWVMWCVSSVSTYSLTMARAFS